MNKRQQKALNNFNNCGHAIKRMINTITMTVECPRVTREVKGIISRGFYIPEYIPMSGGRDELASERAGRIALYVSSEICNDCPFAKLSPLELKEIRTRFEENSPKSN
jgi:hypothetical protein